MIIYGKSSCNHYEKIFDLKNKLYDHIRSHECQKLLFNKSDAANKIVLIKLSISEKNVKSDINIVVKKEGITRFVTTFNSAIKSLTPHDSGLSSLFISETVFSDADTAIKKGEIKFNTHASAAKNITPHQFNSLITPLTTSPLRFRRFFDIK